MTKLIIDATKDKIFLMIIDYNTNYNITYENSKSNYEKLALYINKFLSSKNLDLSKVLEIYVNRGPGSNKTDYYCFSFEDFEQKNDCKYENIPDLCQKFKIKKNLINPIYLS